MFHTGQCLTQFADHRVAFQVFAAVSDTVHRDQHLGCDLLEPVNDSVRAHVRRAHAPNAANADHGQKRHHGFCNIRHVHSDTVAGLHALRLQMQRQRGRLAFQLGPAEFSALPFFVVADDGQHACGVCSFNVAQHLLGVIHFRAGKPARARHGVALEHGGVRCGRLQLQIIPSGLPKSFNVSDRPAPHGLVIIKMQLAVFGQPLLVQADLRDKRRIGWGGGSHDAEVSRASRL